MSGGADLPEVRRSRVTRGLLLGGHTGALPLVPRASRRAPVPGRLDGERGGPAGRGAGMMPPPGCRYERARGERGRRGEGAGVNIRRIAVASVLAWLPLAALAVMAAGMVYITVQQSYRSSANDPQIQMATDARNALESGAAPESLVPSTQLDIARSLSPFLVVYDPNGQVVAASATLHGQPLTLPAGVFASAKSMPVDTITWQPEPGVRNAVAVMSYSGGYVMAGRSLTQVELREDNLNEQVLAALVGTLVGTFVVVALVEAVKARVG